MVGEGFDIKAAGGLMSKELDAFAKVLDNPKAPVLAILGDLRPSIRRRPIHSSFLVYLNCGR